MRMAQEQLQNALDHVKDDKEKASTMLYGIVKRDIDDKDEDEIKVKEQAILQLGSLFAETKQGDELAGLITYTRPFLQFVSKAKASMMVRKLVDKFLDMHAGTGKEITLCKECIEWSKGEKRTFLRQALEARLIALYFENKQYEEALAMGAILLKELKKLDDKILLVEVQLLESKVYHCLGNLPKARAALTTGRTTANGIYCPPKLQAALDEQSGILHAADEKDFKTAYSYFYESFEGYDSIDDHTMAIANLKYMLLSKIMLNNADDVLSIVSGKLALKYFGPDVEAMKKIAKASEKRSLADFKTTLSQYQKELQEDPIVCAHLDSLYDNLLEQNLCRIIEPYSKVQVKHIAQLINLSLDVVEKKLSQMILDKKFSGILDQGAGVLIVFEDNDTDHTYKCALDTIQNMGKVVDSLYNKAKKIV